MGSIMHYAAKDGSRNANPAIEALNPLYQYTMGQRMAISYYDAKIINRAYCGGTIITQYSRGQLRNRYLRKKLNIS